MEHFISDETPHDPIEGPGAAVYVVLGLILMLGIGIGFAVGVAI